MSLCARNCRTAVKDVYDFSFHPGFSTAEQVTDVSGRGVGMDVVRKNIEALRGTIEIASKTGHGTTFTVRLPLTLAILDGMLIKVGAWRYVPPVLSVRRFLRPARDQLRTVAGGEAVAVRGDIVPIYRLHHLFGVEAAVEDPCDGLLANVEGDGTTCSLLFDDLLDQQSVVVKSLGSALGDRPGIAGAAVLSDGSVGLILDVAGIIRLARTSEPPPCRVAVTG